MGSGIVEFDNILFWKVAFNLDIHRVEYDSKPIFAPYVQLLPMILLT
jgi:hypothetical protein